MGRLLMNHSEGPSAFTSPPRKEGPSRAERFSWYRFLYLFWLGKTKWGAQQSPVTAVVPSWKKYSSSRAMKARKVSGSFSCSYKDLNFTQNRWAKKLICPSNSRKEFLTCFILSSPVPIPKFPDHGEWQKIINKPVRSHRIKYSSKKGTLKLQAPSQKYLKKTYFKWVVINVQNIHVHTMTFEILLLTKSTSS